MATIPKNFNVIVPSKNSYRQLLIVIVGLLLVGAIYYFFVPAKDSTTEIYKQTNEILQTKIDDLEKQLQERSQAYEARQDSLLILQNQLHIAAIKKRNLQKQLRDAKNKLQLATDADNVNFYIEYINSYKPNNAASKKD